MKHVIGIHFSVLFLFVGCQGSDPFRRIGAYSPSPQEENRGNVANRAETPASINFDPLVLDYQTQSIFSHTTKTVTLENIGERSATDITVYGGSVAYTIRNLIDGASTNEACGLTLAGGKTCKLYVTYHPKNIGAHRTVLTVNYFDGEAKKGLEVPISGNSVTVASLKISNAQYTPDGVSTDSTDFGIQIIGSGAIERTFDVVHAGAYPATTVSFSPLFNSFEYVADPQKTTCPIDKTGDSNFQISANCKLTVRFLADSGGIAEQSIVLRYNDSAKAAQTQHTLTGNSIAPAKLSYRLSSEAPPVTSFSFGKRLKDGSFPVTLFILNSGDVDAKNVAPTLTGSGFTFAGGAYPGISGGCGTTIAKKDTCQIRIEFNPKVLGNLSSQFILTYSSGLNTSSEGLSLSGIGAEPARVAITPAVHSFGEVSLRDLKRKTFEVSLLSPIDTSLNPFNFSISLTATSSFTLTSSTCVSIFPCTFVVTFQPTTTTAFATTAQVIYNDGSLSNSSRQRVTADLSGAGVATPLVRLSGCPTYFGDVPVGAKKIKSVNLNFFGNGPISITPKIVSTTLAFAYEDGAYPGGGTCSLDQTLDERSSGCSVQIAFSPPSAGTHQGAFEVSFLSGTTQTISCSLIGNGTIASEAVLTFRDSPEFNFGTLLGRGPVEVALGINKTGSLSATQVTPSLTDGMSTTFTLKPVPYPGQCPSTINSAGNNVCAPKVIFSPTTLGTHRQRLTLSYGNGKGEVKSVSLNLVGKAFDQAVVTISGSGEFKKVAVGSTQTRILILTNSGNVSANIVSQAVGSLPFAVDSSNCGATLMPQQSCSTVLRFSPITPGFLSDSFRTSYTYFDGESEVPRNPTTTLDISGTGTYPMDLSANGDHTCILSDVGSIRCAGRNNYGQLGTGNLSDYARFDRAVPLPNGLYVKSLSSGGFHTCAILSDNSLRCWGRNLEGQAGGTLAGPDGDIIGDTLAELGDALEPINLGLNLFPVAVSSGLAHTCVLLNNSNIKCWGLNLTGQLGLGDTVNRGRKMGEIAALPTVDLGGRVVSEVASDAGHTCARFTNGQAACWGDNIYGQAVVPNNRDPSKIIVGDSASEMGLNLKPIALGDRNVIQLSTGGGFSCFLREDRSLGCFGKNETGLLGHPFCQDFDGNSGICGSLPYLFALPGYGNRAIHSLVPIPLGSGLIPTAMSSANSGSCVLLSNDSAQKFVKCWGKNDFGQLGQGDRHHRGDDPNELGDTLGVLSLGSGLVPRKLTSGHSHHCALFTRDNTFQVIKCWGKNTYGQLGTDNQLHLGDDENEMGENLPIVFQ